MEPEVLTKVEEIISVDAEESKAAANLIDDAEHPAQHTELEEVLDDDNDEVDGEDDSLSLYEELLDGDDETYDHIRGLSEGAKICLRY